MNNTFSLQQISQTVDIIADILMRQYIIDKMTKFMEIKSINSK